MNNSTFLTRIAPLLLTFVFSTVSFAQDFNVQHLQDDIGRTGGTNTGFTPVASLNNAIELANNNRKSQAGVPGSGGNLESDDLAGARQLTATGTLSYYRESASVNSNTRFNTSIWEYVGTPGGPNEFIVRGRYSVTLNGTNNNTTQALSGVVNAAKCIPFITGIMNNSTSDDADSGTALAYLENASTLRVQKGSNGNNVTVYVTVVEFTGTNWTVLHGDSGNSASDTGNITLSASANGIGAATNVSGWGNAVIFAHHIGDTGSSGTNDAIADNWPVMTPGSSNQLVDWTFNANHDSAGTNRHFVHVLDNTGMNVTRFQSAFAPANETTVNIAAAGLTSTSEALIVGSSTSSGNGTAYGRGWRNYYFNSTTQAAHWSHRSGNSTSHEIQIIDLSGLTGSPQPEMDVTGLGNSILDGDTTPAVADDTDWGTVAIGTPVVHTFTIHNTGTAPLNLTGAAPFIVIGGANPGDFAISAPPANVVPPGGISNFNVTFLPTATGLRSATLTIANDDSDENPYNFDIQGTGTSPAQEIDITGLGNSIANNDLTPSVADDTDFGTVIVSSSVVHTFTILNQGGANPLNLVGPPYVNIAGPNAADFTVTVQPISPIAAGNSTTFNVRFSPSAVGLRQAVIVIGNDDSDENPYRFAIQGTGTLNTCPGPLVNTFPYEESFESGTGLWSQDLTDNFDWTNQTGGTPTGNTGPNGAHDGSYYMYTEASANYNNTANLISPCVDLTGTVNPRVTMFYHMHGQDMGNLNVDLSTDGGTTFPVNLTGYNGEVQNSGNSSWIPISFDLSAYIGQTIRIRVQGITGNNYRSDLAIDKITFTVKAEPTTAPGGVTSDLTVWLKANDGHSLNDGQSMNNWVDQGRGGDAYAKYPAQAPTYHDNVTDNLNFNPVVEFDNAYATYTLDSDFSHDSGAGHFLTSEYGFHTQDIFVVLITDETPITNNFGFMDVFCSDAHLDQNATDATGVGFGYYTARVNGEIICYAHDSFSTGQSPPDGYAVAEIGTGSVYDNVGIINTRNNPGDTQQELYYNQIDIETTQNDIPEYMNTNDSRYWIGRSEGWESSLNARVVEMITYSSRKDDGDLTQERNRISSYLAVKYGITLGVNGTSQDYVDSQGRVIWDQSDNAGFNYDIAGIGRDDASALLQKQSSSINNGVDAIGPTEGILTIGLTEIYDTNNLNISDNPDTFNNREFLMWGNNGVSLDLPEAPVGVNMSAGIVPALNTDVSFTGMQRHWKFVETGGDIGLVKVQIPQAAIRNINPPGDYLMLISDSPVFDPTATYRVMKSDGMGNLFCFYDFDGTKYITFGYAPQVISDRSIRFDGISDYVDMENQLNLNTTEFTVSAWIKRDTGSENSSILSKRDAAYTEGYDLRFDGGGRVEMSWKNGSTEDIRSNVSIPENKWHHVAVIFDGTEANLYIDGVLDQTENLTPPVDTNQSFYLAAAGKNTPVAHYRGNIDEVRIWDRALTVDQMRFIMNQEIADNAGFVSGKELPTTITKNEVGSIPWTDLAAYYDMTIYTYTNVNDVSGNDVLGALRNLDTVDRQTAPLPYVSNSDGDWTTPSTWLNDAEQNLPNDVSIVDSNMSVDWNIVEASHDIRIATDDVLGRDRSVLALKQYSGDIQIDGDTAAGTGNGLTVTHYLQLDGTVDLEGESQLVQTLGSDLEVTSSGTLERDQQGTADVYTYNYWAAPVGVSNITSNNNSYTVDDVIFDDTQNINWITTGYNGTNTNPIGIADYWIWKFANQLDDDYPSWQHVRSTGNLLAGEGFTMKGPGSGGISDDQNYVFNGKPHNAVINLPLSAGNDYLVGNPYASAIDAHQFILDNGPVISGTGATTGTLYFWEHWGGGSHVLSEYLGGYGTYNLSGGAPSAALGTNDPDVGTGGTPTKLPGRYIPVGQGFFVVAEGTGTINFNNGQRVYHKESSGNSIFMEANQGANITFGSGTAPAAQSNNNNSQTFNSNDPRTQVRIGFNSINTLRRQLLLTIDENATADIDWGYDAEVFADQMDDLYWIIEDKKHNIQGIGNLTEMTTLALGVHSNIDGMNSISLDSFSNNTNGLKAYVYDSELEVYHDLTLGDYEFFLTAGEHTERFSIVFSTQALNIDDPEYDQMDVHYVNDIDSIILINPTLKEITSIVVYDALGKAIYSVEEIVENSYSEYEVSNLSTGTYILKINTRGGSFSKMVLVN
ncbi:MAG: choice-of-anchor D domain-containing protein [Bacteroidia bacterium]|nr:choice-of-anchor D domain-containing protein [Bacteroidia bacterium]